MTKLTLAETITAVREHALRNYNKGGWDVIVECWSDEDIAGVIGGARSIVRALKAVRPVVDVYADRQADAVNSAF